MSIADTTNKVREAGNDVKTAFDFPFKIFEEGDIEVYKIDQDTGVATLQVLNTDYTVEINDTSEGGTVTYTVAPTSDEDSFIDRVVEYTQPVIVPEVGPLREVSISNALDRNTILAQQLLNLLSLSLKLPSTSEYEDLTVPDPVSQKILRWKADLSGLENADLTVTETQYNGTISAGNDADKAASPSANDIYVAVDTGRIYKCFTAGTWTLSINFGAVTDIASASTVNIGALTSNLARITGTTTITAFDSVTAGVMRFVRFAGALTLTHNATTLILPTGANITTAAGDTALFVSEGSGNWRCLFYQKVSGAALAGLPKGYLDGGIISNNATDATNDLDITATKCRDDGDAVDMTIGAMTKRVDATWTAGTAGGGLDTGTIGASNDLIYIFAISKADGSDADYLFSKSASAPTMPATYTKKRLIGARRWAATAWPKFRTTGNGREKLVTYDTAIIVVDDGNGTSFADVDCGDGGAECVPSTSRFVLGHDWITNTSGSVTLYLRPNGSAEAIDNANAHGYQPGGSSARIGIPWQVAVDADGIFEYAVASGNVGDIMVRGYREDL